MKAMAQTLGRCLSIFDAPSELFEEVAASPLRLTNWLVPTLLVILTSLVLLEASNNREHTAVVVGAMVEAGELSAAQAPVLTDDWQRVSAGAVCLGALAGTCWSALLLWSIGRVLLQARFSYWKALEVAGLASMIAALGALVSMLLVAASGDAAARPALSLLVHLPLENPLRLFLDGLNVFHLWTTAVLAIGLARLSGVSLKQSGFWVFGYWLCARLAGVLLAC